MPDLERPLLLFTTLLALYSPLASISSYFPVLAKLEPGEQRRLSLALFVNVGLFVVTALWVGQPLLSLLGLKTAALSVTGGIALFFTGLPMMRGLNPEPPAAQEGHTGTHDWREVALMPVTFPLTVGGTSFGILVAFRSLAEGVPEVLALTAAGLAYAAVTGLTLFASGHIERRVGPRTRATLQRISGVLLVAIAVTLVSAGGTRMVLEGMRTARNPGPPVPPGRSDPTGVHGAPSP